MSGEPLRDLMDFAVELAWRAGRLTLARFQTGLDVETKSDRSPVTIADREAERLCRDAIVDRFPEDGIAGEEFGEERPESPRRWILDPIDGTRSFVRGVPFYGVLIALETGADAVLGVLHFPALGETLWAARGLGCWWNGRRARVSDVASMEQAAFLITDGRALGDARWDRLRENTALVRTWGDCYGHALVATGRAEMMVDPVAAVWDAAPLRPVIEEAGGVFTDLAGRSAHRGGSAVSTNAALAVEARAWIG